MVIPLLVIFVALAYVILRMETFMADFSKLTAAVDLLTVDVDAAVAALHAAHGEDPAVQKAIDDATAAVKAQADKLAAAVPPPPSP
jgi:outer membrane murein-binding lipoprotein Lpp